MSEYETSYDPDNRPAPAPRSGLLYLAAASALLFALGAAVLGILLITAGSNRDSAVDEANRARHDLEDRDNKERALRHEMAQANQAAEEQVHKAKADVSKAEEETAQARKNLDTLQKKVDAGAKPLPPTDPSEAEKLLQQARQQLADTEKKLQEARVQLAAAEKRAKEAGDKAEAARTEAAGARREAMKQVVALQTAHATQLLDAGDLPRALLFYTEALRLAHKEGLPEQAHRSGLAMALGRYPKPIQTWFADNSSSDAHLSPDGRQVVTTGAEGVRFWDIATGKQVGEPLTDSALVSKIDFSPDGKKLLGIAANGRVHLWDIATRKIAIPPLEPGARVGAALFSPDGKRILIESSATPGSTSLRVWDAIKGEAIGKAHDETGSLLALTFSADGSEVLMAGADKNLRHWNPLTEKIAGVLLSHPGDVNHMAFSPDGKRIVTAGTDNSVRVWQVETGQPLTPLLTKAGSVIAPQFSPDGLHLLTVSGDRTAHVWDAANGESVAQLRHGDRVGLAAFSPDGRHILTGCADGTLHLWDGSSGEEIQRIWQEAAAQSATFSPDGAAVLVSEGKALRLWDLTVAESTAQSVTESALTWFSPDGKLILRAKGNTAQLSTVDKDTPVGPPLKHKAPITAAMFSGDSKSVAIMCNASQGSDIEFQIQVWDTATGKESRPVLTFLHPVTSMAFNRDGKTVLTVSVANATEFRLAFYEAATGKLMGKEVLFAMPPARAQFTPDGKLAVTAMPAGQVKMWDPATSEQSGKSTTHHAPLTQIVFSADNKKMLTADRAGIVFIGEVGTGEAICQLPDHPGAVTFGAFSPDGKRVVTGCADGNVRVWDIDKAPMNPPDKPVYSLSVAAGALVAFSPDGRWLATADGKRLRLWDAASGEAVGPSLTHAQGSAITYLAFTKDGKVVTGAGMADDPRVRQTWNLTPDTRPVADLEQLVQLLTGHRLDGLSVAAIKPDDAKKAWDNLNPRYPSDFTASPEKLLAWSRRGLDECERTKNWAGVLTHIDRLIAADPSRVELYLRRATIHKSQHQLDQTLADLSKAIEQAKDRADLWQARADAYVEQKQWDKAAADYSQVIERSPNDPDTWTNRGRAYAELGQWDKAAADFGKAVTKGRDDVNGFRDHALACLGAGDMAGYKAVCTRMAKRFGKDRATAQIVGWTCALADGALADLKPLMTQAERGVADNAKSATHLITLAALQYRVGQYPPARDNLEKAQPLRGMSDAPSDWLLLALTLEKLKRIDEAKAWLDKAAKADQPSVQQGRSWQQRLEVSLLRKQAEGALKGGKP